MKRVVLGLMIEIVAVAGLLSAGNTFASDGDVDYSAPYITVDPETGKLVTVNPGPQLRVHPPASSNETIPGAAAATDAKTAMPQSTMAGESGQQTGLFPIILIIAIVVLIAAVFVAFKSSQRRKIVSPTSTEYASQDGSP
jgi:hypothetical protein